MTATDELDYDRAAQRIGRSMTVIAALGTVATLATLGWRWGAGFLLGALFSGLNYRWLRGLVEGLGAGKPPRGAVFLAFRYLLLGGGGYVILRYSPINRIAVLTGLFVLTAAVFVEVIFEIVYARK
jgi:hypothetical protein